MKRATVELPDQAEGVVLVLAIWHDRKGRTELLVDHRSTTIPFEVAREALVNALALVEPDSDPRFKADRRLSEATRGLEFVETDETRKEPS